MSMHDTESAAPKEPEEMPDLRKKGRLERNWRASSLFQQHLAHLVLHRPQRPPETPRLHLLLHLVPTIVQGPAGQ